MKINSIYGHLHITLSTQLARNVYNWYCSRLLEYQTPDPDFLNWSQIGNDCPSRHHADWALTHWVRDKMAAISQTTHSNALSWIKIYEFWLKISRQFVPQGPINNIPALVPIVAWRRQGDKPLSEPMMTSLLTHICVTQPQWVLTVNSPTGMSCSFSP